MTAAVQDYGGTAVHKIAVHEAEDQPDRGLQAGSSREAEDLWEGELR